MDFEETERLRQAIETLALSDDRDQLAAAAVYAADSGDPEALGVLGRLLVHRAFLQRLDDVSAPQDRTWHVGQILAAIGRHPSERTGAMLVELAGSSEFLEIDDRRIPLLPALAAVRPMSAEGAVVMRRAAAEGYYSTVLPLLVANGSPRALALFEELIRDARVDPESRVGDLHAALLPHRNQAEVLHSSERLLAAALEPIVEFGLLETIFDYRSREWFGPAVNPPRPPAWEQASIQALQQLLYLAHQARQRGLSPELSSAVDRTAEAAHAILEARQ
jgi:hypothetical protein